MLPDYQFAQSTPHGTADHRVALEHGYGLDDVAYPGVA